MEKKRLRAEGPTLAPGMDDGQELERSATKQEIERGEYTEVVKLSYDEVDASE
ncbi:hypothetical protein ACFDTO_29705 [Microbacteriaceae bacterium 4G12]